MNMEHMKPSYHGIEPPVNIKSSILAAILFCQVIIICKWQYLPADSCIFSSSSPPSSLLSDIGHVACQWLHAVASVVFLDFILLPTLIFYNMF
jgi:hypothetical protein